MCRGMRKRCAYSMRGCRPFLKKVEPGDLVIFTADHGNDPTFAGTDHTREEVPVIALHEGRTGPVGTRETFADVAATLADYFGLSGWKTGRSFLKAAAVPR